MNLSNVRVASDCIVRKHSHTKFVPGSFLRYSISKLNLAIKEYISESDIPSVRDNLNV